LAASASSCRFLASRCSFSFWKRVFFTAGLAMLLLLLVEDMMLLLCYAKLAKEACLCDCVMCVCGG
jgi:hypothetical protein